MDKDKAYTLKEGLAILKKAPKTKFDSSVDLAINLNVDPKQSSQMVRGTASLPHGTGKSLKVACFCKGEKENEAKKAGADYVGHQELVAKVRSGWCDFDVAVATPDMMRDIASLGKILGPRGLMPNPKSGTVTNDVASTITEVKKGKVEFKMSKQADMHLSVGRVSFGEKSLYENTSTVIKAISHSRPAAVKGQFIKSIFISTSMGPGVRLDLNKWE